MRLPNVLIRALVCGIASLALGLAAVGCGGGVEEEGHKFEKPADADKPSPKDKPDAFKDMSPRQKRALEKEKDQ